ncbi:MAG: 50S ribosomal protein L18 [Chitinophagales bacterium]|nr:50S ribosomal protein L18 [Chitinophagales bacterium]
MAFSKVKRRKKIRMGISRKIRGTAERPRLAVFRSNKEIYAQIIDDLGSNTLVFASSRESGVDTKGTKTEVAKKVGEALGKKAKDAGIESVVFDRGGYLYHGRVKALADGARENGLKF